MRRNLVTSILFTITMLCCSRAEAIDWETDFEKASSAARDSGKYILPDFSGSDWCGWCIRLENEVFSQDTFQDFAKENLVCVLVDFPSQKEQSRELKQQNRDLAAKYWIRGYPTIIILRPDGEPIARTGYRQGGPVKYAQHLKEIIENHKAEQ